VRRTPLAFGWLAKTRIPGEVLAAWTRPIYTDAAVRADARKVLRGIDNRFTLEAATRLRDFPGPTLLAWGAEDKFFKPKFAERLAADIPGSRLEWIDDARTFVSEDQPERLAGLIGEFATV
jgi:pimeloyl-ACP methyl ester carboxylesterase